MLFVLSTGFCTLGLVWGKFVVSFFSTKARYVHFPVIANLETPRQFHFYIQLYSLITLRIKMVSERFNLYNSS